MNKLTKLPPAWHSQAKKIIADSFIKDHSLFLDSTKRATWWGMFFNHIKFRGDKKTGDGSIPHGEFGPWLKENAPKEISWDLANVYMRLANGVCEKGKFEIRGFLEFATSGNLPPKIEQMIEGKTQQQLFWDFKNVDGDGNPRKPGQQKGSKGLTKEMRMKAAYASQAEHLKDLKITTDYLSAMIPTELNLKGFAALDETPGGKKTLDTFMAVIEEAHLHFVTLKKSRGGK